MPNHTHHSHDHELGPSCMMTSVDPVGGAVTKGGAPSIMVGVHNVCDAPAIMRDLNDVHQLTAYCSACNHPFEMDPNWSGVDEFSEWAHEFFNEHGAE